MVYAAREREGAGLESPLTCRVCQDIFCCIRLRAIIVSYFVFAHICFLSYFICRTLFVFVIFVSLLYN